MASIVMQAVGQRRWGIGILLGLGVLVNYFDRVGLSAAAPQLQEQFALSATEMGAFFSVFFLPYAFLQIPAGIVLDRFGTVKVGRIGSFLWIIASGITAIATGLGGIMIARGLLGIAEAPGFMVNSKATGYWFPRVERALATAIFDSAAKFSNVIGVPMVAYIVVTFGWRYGFVLTAVLSLLYFVAFFVFYRDPSGDTKLSSEERRYIVEGGAAPEGQSAASAVGILGYLLQQKKVWGLAIGFGAYGYSFYLFLTWLPTYLVKTMHMGILKSAGYSAIPWLVATVSDLVIGGWLIDALIMRGFNESKVRKTVLIVGMVFGTAVFAATQTTDPVWAVTWISIALAGLAAAAPVSWSLPSLIAPRGGVGSVGGIMNFSNNLAGFVAPFVTGYIVDQTDSFAPAFALAGVILLIGIASFVFLLGPIAQIPDAPADAVT